MTRNTDPMGCAIAEYYKSGRAEKLRIFSPMFEEDEIPVEILFRTYDDMSEIEQNALDMARGTILDVGAGSGCHSLALQNRGADVTAIEISPLSVETMKSRGVKKILEQDFFTLDNQQYSTILMLMNGIGIVGTIERLPVFFKLLDKILLPGGQLLCDSSDISYVFEDENGIIEYPDTGGYYGELKYQMQYRDVKGKPFDWLYIDAQTLRLEAEKYGYETEVLVEGDHYDYLARIYKRGERRFC